MTKLQSLQVTSRRENRHPLNQSALYSIGSKARLATVLQTTVDHLVRLAASIENYKTFPLPEETCRFTGKVRKERWVQEPKKDLRKVHERVQTLLRRITPPQYSHAAVKGRSYRSNAIAHQNAVRVATFDIRKFYGSTSDSRVHNFLVQQMRCAPDVAALLTKLLCCEGYLPTGSPLSPLLSLYANGPMFDELDRLAFEHGMTFTCYIDDLTFSGLHIPKGLPELVKRIVERHGHCLAEGKTKIYRKNQIKHVTGVVLHKNRIGVPHSRMLKARAILKAIGMETDLQNKITLSQKLAGLLGEAAYLDPKYAARAKKSYMQLRALQQTAIVLRKFSV